ncbi:hypothetical protein H0H92_013937 [Tricholoma furcatifolium]|nr:hypothetical protein H0H92_013937 [Tricholoma furcatifolium]
MYYDLNVPIPTSSATIGASVSKKGKGKQQNPLQGAPAVFTALQIDSIDARIDLLVRLGYTVIAFNQLAHKRVDPKTHVNTAEALVSQLKKRQGVVYLKRLSIILDEESEKGFGLTNANASLFMSYDLIGLIPLTQAAFSLACLTHSMPSPLTAHIISLPLTLPRLSFYLKHTLIRTAIKNGAVFEISYVGAVGGENDPLLVDAGGAENGAGSKRNWWAAAKELARVTKGRNLLISGGVMSDADLRAPKDVGNLITLLGLAQDVSHSSLTKVPKSLLLRAETRFTYRAVFSEPKVIIPGDAHKPSGQTCLTGEAPIVPDSEETPSSVAVPSTQEPPKKRPREEGGSGAGAGQPTDGSADSQQKKRRKKNKGSGQAPI